jgi:hypothetical protein
MTEYWKGGWQNPGKENGKKLEGARKNTRILDGRTLERRAAEYRKGGWQNRERRDRILERRITKY